MAKVHSKLYVKFISRDNSVDDGVIAKQTAVSLGINQLVGEN